LVTTDSHGKNVTITSNDEKANVLGNHFSQIFTKETKDMIPPKLPIGSPALTLLISALIPITS